MIRTSCLQCDKYFYVKPNRLLRGWGKYCSRSCQNLSQKTGDYVQCHNCKKPIYKNRMEIKRSKSGCFFCNKSCQTIWRNREVYVGDRHSNWTTGKASYRKNMLRSEKPHICSKCRTEDTRVLAVHHLDKNRDNNKLDNLIWLCHNCHYLVHHFANEALGFIHGSIKIVPSGHWQKR